MDITIHPTNEWQASGNIAVVRPPTTKSGANHDELRKGGWGGVALNYHRSKVGESADEDIKTNSIHWSFGSIQTFESPSQEDYTKGTTRAILVKGP